MYELNNQTHRQGAIRKNWFWIGFGKYLWESAFEPDVEND